jgi:hypothetical protein
MASAAAELAKLKQQRKKFGAPASPEDAAHNLSSPEVAPIGIADAQPAAYAVVEAPAAQEAIGTPATAAPAAKRKSAVKSPAALKPQPSAPMIIETSPISVRLRRSRRIIPLSTRVTPEFDQLLRETAAREGVQFIDILERALQAYVNDDA